jgi:PEP-CTERM motif
MNTVNATLRALGFVCALSLVSLAHATPQTMTADFEGDLSAWTERNPAAPTGMLVADPLGSGRGQVLTFQLAGSTGTLFSQMVTSPNAKFLLTFDYLGLYAGGPNPTDLGGYIGVVNATGSGQWVGGTGSHPTPINLIDDGLWRTHTYSFTSEVGSSLRVMLQDWDGSGRTVRDAHFDNITLTSVPEPTSLALVALALAAVGATAKRRAAQRT